MSKSFKEWCKIKCLLPTYSTVVVNIVVEKNTAICCGFTFVPFTDRKDRMSMAHGLEVRVPFCDYRLVEYAYNIPTEFKNYRDREKGLVRHAMEGVLPEHVLWRKKSPYPKTHNPNYLELLTNRLRGILNSDDCRLTEIVNADALREMLDTNGASFTKNWYGQLMTVPQTFAYFLQINAWLNKYNVIIED